MYVEIKYPSASPIIPILCTNLLIVNDESFPEMTPYRANNILDTHSDDSLCEDHGSSCLYHAPGSGRPRWRG